MTANADYGVSIVESFAPPANWLPGQEVNKDVYAVNTGNIAAFVKEKLSGVLDYSYETLVSKFDATTCVELVPMANEEIDGATTNEAGSFLAWTDTDEPTGFKKSERTEDDTDNNAWHPTKTGHYIFRRSVGTDATTGDTKFTYAGYYFVKGKDPVAAVTDPETGEVTTPAQPAVPDKYYKIVIGNDAFRAATDNGTVKHDEDGSVRYVFDLLCNQDDLYTATTEVANDGTVTVTPVAITPAADGTFKEKPIISYVKVVDLDPQDVAFKYNDGTDDKYGDDVPYLMVRFSNAQGDLAARTADLAEAKADLAAAEDALVAAKEAAAVTSHDLAEKEVDYRNAEYAYYTALARYNKTKADMDYANALVTATNKLYEPALNRANAEKKMETLKKAMEDAAKAVRDEANNEQGETNTADGVDGTDFITDNYNAVKSDMLNSTTGIASDVLVPQNIRDLIDDNINNASPAGGSDLTQAKANLEVFDSIWKQIAGDDGDGTGGILKKITDDYDKYQATVAVGNKETDTDPDILDREADAEHDIAQGYLQDLKADLDRLEVLLKAYADAYTAFTETAADGSNVETALTHLTNGLETSVVDNIGAYSKGDNDANGKINKLEAKANTTGQGGLKDKIKAYNDAYDAYYNYMDSAGGAGTYYEAVNAWNDAVTTYNNEVYNNDDSAKKKYDNTIDTTVVNTKNLAEDGVTITDDSGEWKLVSDGTDLVSGFSAHSVGNNTAAMAAADFSNLTERPAGVDGPVSAANTDATDPRITGDDTNYLLYVLEDTDYDPDADFDPAAGATHNSPYKTMTQVDTKAEDAFYQLGADPAAADNQKLSALNSDLGTATTSGTKAYNYKYYKDLYDGAVETATAEGGDIANLTAAEQAVADAEAALDAARIAEAVQSDVGSNIKIDVVLDKNVIKDIDQPTDNATWIFDTSTDNTQTPTFYYNRILDAGETSEKLVDKLVFCDDVTAKDFTELQFDLNVALDSMQVTYDPQDNVTMTPTAVNASDDFAMTAEITNQETKAVNWDQVAATPTVYKVGDNEVTVTDLGEGNEVTVGATKYRYTVTVDGVTYYGVSQPEAGDTATYYKITGTGSGETPTLVTGEGSTVTVTAALAE